MIEVCCHVAYSPTFDEVCCHVAHSPAFGGLAPSCPTQGGSAALTPSHTSELDLEHLVQDHKGRCRRAADARKHTHSLRASTKRWCTRSDQISRGRLTTYGFRGRAVASPLSLGTVILT